MEHRVILFRQLLKPLFFPRHLRFPVNSCYGARGVSTNNPEVLRNEVPTTIDNASVVDPRVSLKNNNPNLDLPTENDFSSKISEMLKTEGKDVNSRFLRNPLKRLNERLKAKADLESSRILQFRDVSKTLDSLKLSRDIFFFPKWFLYGKEYVLNLTLERMLRYYKEHALADIKLIYEGKLMRGPPFLFPSSGDPSYGFPSVSGANILKVLSSSSRKYDIKNKSSFENISRESFQAPTLVILSHSGQEHGLEAEGKWLKLATDYNESQKSKSISDREIPMAIGSFAPNAGKWSTKKHTGINICLLKSLELFPYAWFQSTAASSFLKSLTYHTLGNESFITFKTIKGQWIIKAQPENILLGSHFYKILLPFLGFRNFLTNYVFLVDHKGEIRWISSGFPDKYEKGYFSSLLSSLERDYIISLKKKM